MLHFFSNAKKFGCELKETEPMPVKTMAWLILLFLLAPTTLLQAQTDVGPVVGSSIKDFALNNQHGAPTKLTELLSEGTTALVVVQSAGWCRQSKEHLVDLQQQAESFATAGLKIACLSYDNVDVLNSFAAQKGIEFPMLADPKSKVIRQLGLVNAQFKKNTVRYGLAHPTTILIDRAGNVIDVMAGLTEPMRLLKLWETRKTGVVAEEVRPDFIAVKGNKFVDERGTQVLFKGLAIADPHKILKDGRWND